MLAHDKRCACSSPVESSHFTMMVKRNLAWSPSFWMETAWSGTIIAALAHVSVSLFDIYLTQVRVEFSQVGFS